jgi:hypothetical protein
MPVGKLKPPCGGSLRVVPARRRGGHGGHWCQEGGHGGPPLQLFPRYQLKLGTKI